MNWPVPTFICYAHGYSSDLKCCPKCELLAHPVETPAAANRGTEVELLNKTLDRAMKEKRIRRWSYPEYNIPYGDYCNGDDVAKLERTNKRLELLRRRLLQYVQHKGDCGSRWKGFGEMPCTCGLSAILRKENKTNKTKKSK